MKKKYWAKPDEMWLNDMDAKVAKVDHFKENRQINRKSRDVVTTGAKVTSKPGPDPAVSMKQMNEKNKTELKSRFSTDISFYRGIIKPGQGYTQFK